jgi:hypothetical protein
MTQRIRNIIFAVLAHLLLLSGSATAQIQLNPASPSPDLLWHFFGAINSVEVPSTDVVRSFYLAATYQGDVLFTDAIELDRADRTVITAGVLAVALQGGCRDGIIVFVRSEQYRIGGQSTSLSSVCFQIPGFLGGSVSKAAGERSIFLGVAPTEVPLNRWEPFLVYVPTLAYGAPLQPSPDPWDAVVFLLYLSDEALPADSGQRPQVPLLETWHDLP